MGCELPRWLSVCKASACSVGDAGDVSLIPGSGRSAGEGNGNPLQYSCLENPMDSAAWQATIYRVGKSQTRLKQLSTSTDSNGIKTFIWFSTVPSATSSPEYIRPSGWVCLGLI